MRLSNTLHSIAVLSLLALVGCKQVEIPDAEKPNGWGSAEKVKQEIKVENVQELGLPENVIKDGLALSVFSSMSPADNNQFTYSNSAFSGEAAEGGFLVAMYPYSAEATMSVEANKMYINTVIPSTQNFVEVSDDGFSAMFLSSRQELVEDNTKDDNNRVHELFFAVNSGSGFNFKPVYSKVILPIKASYDLSIDSIGITGRNGEHLSGNTKIEVNTDSYPISHMSDTASVNIGYKGNLNLIEGVVKNVMFSFLPQKFNDGLSISLYNDGKELLNRNYESLTVNSETYKFSEIEISKPNNYIEYNSDVKINVEGYLCDYEDGIGHIYFESTTVPEFLLSNNTDITGITISDNIVSIGKEAFLGCTNLKTIEFNEGLKDIQSKAFYGTGVTSLEFPASLENVYGWAFQNCNSLENIKFGEVTGTINEDTHKYTSITSSTSLLKFLGYGVFADCDNIKGNIVFPSCLEKIEDALKWMGGDNSEMIDFYFLGSTPPKASANTFQSSKYGYIFVNEDYLDSYRTSSNWPAGKIYKIGETEFSGEGETNYYIEYTSDSQIVKDGYYGTYESSTGTGKIYFQTNTIPDGFFNSSDIQQKVTSLTISKDIETIGEFSFNSCKLISKLKFEDGSKLKTIGKNAFDNIGLSISGNMGEISLPSGVSSIGDYAFRNNKFTKIDLSECTNLQVLPTGFSGGSTTVSEIHIPSSIQTINSNALNIKTKTNNKYSWILISDALNPPAVPSGKSLSEASVYPESVIVPDGSVGNYENANGWKVWKGKGTIFKSTSNN